MVLGRFARDFDAPRCPIETQCGLRQLALDPLSTEGSQVWIMPLTCTLESTEEAQNHAGTTRNPFQAPQRSSL